MHEDEVVVRLLAVADGGDGDVDSLENGFRCMERRGRVVVASDDDDAAAALLGASAEEGIVHLEGIVRRQARVENITGNKKKLDGLFLERIEKPGQERAMLLVAFLLFQQLSEMPIRRMKNLHSMPSQG
ncbi:MAG: hypothetical protein BWY66_00663 [bacterium ADurb.Bin374]|nr:MAG: hypothetical protein BWY66_00663 [bacterium ADurb.Bin374]